MYVACDFSGIQRYVLDVKAAGKAQAKRLRARSFLLELFERAALITFKDRLGIGDDDVLVSGGGGFLVRVSSETDLDEVEKTGADMARKVWDETGGELQFASGNGSSPMTARARLEYGKRRPGIFILQDGGRWRTDHADALSRPSLGDPCDVCGRAPGARRVEGEDEDALYCEGCIRARRLGERVVEWDWMRPAREGGVVSVLGVGFDHRPGDPTEKKTSDAFKVSRWIPRNGNVPLTFEEISMQASGDGRLAVLKADVDDMGTRIGEIAARDRSYKALKEFSRSLHSFFVDDIQGMLSESWPSLYTIYAGGDDLLIVGPWNIIMDFAGELSKEFKARVGDKYDLTLSAGIALTPYRVPIRRAVERAEVLLDSAKDREGKSSCATLNSIWKWQDHKRVIGDGKKLARQVVDGEVSRSLLQRLLDLAGSEETTRMARWVYQVQRNVRNPEIRRWAVDEGKRLQDGRRVGEIAASLKYALLATRTRGGR